MKQRLFRISALLLAFVLLLTVMPTAVSAAPETASPLLAFVPLDNRPVCVDRVRYAAAAAGFDVQMPQEALYRTLLDGQGTNPNGTQHGDGEGIMTWLESMEASGCDLYIIHLDQLLSGGLVGSRDPDNTSGGADAAECALLSRLAAITDKTDENGQYENRVYLVDTVMRLASTGGYKGLAGTQYDAFREYAAKARKQFSVTAADVDDWDGAVGYIDTVYANYAVAPNGDTITYNKEALTETMVQQYHNARRRKLDILHWLRLHVQNNDSTVFVFGVDDASPENTIQTNEINFIKALMDRYEIYLSADTDSSGLMALARCVNDYYAVSPTIRVRYFGSMADKAADEYDIGTLRENMRTHVESLNAVYVDETNASASADIEVLVLTQIADGVTIRNNGANAAYENNIRALADTAKANIAADIPTIVIDASTGSNYYSSWVKGLANLQETLLSEVEISKLLGYSNWNTVGNSIGIALGTGVSRYAYLVSTEEASAASNAAFQQSITFAYIKDITYNARNKAGDFTWQFKYWLMNTAGWSDSNFYQQMLAYDYETKKDWELCSGERYVNNGLEWCLMNGNNPEAYSGCGRQVLNALMAGDYYTKLGSSVKTADVDTISLDRYRFPWYRVFEITFDIIVTETLSTSFGTAAPSQRADEFIAWMKAALGASDASVSAPNNAAFTYVGTGFHATATVNGQLTPYTVVVSGDVTGDGTANTSDVRAVLEHVLAQKTFSAAQKAAADVDANSEVSSSDARTILQSFLY